MRILKRTSILLPIEEETKKLIEKYWIRKNSSFFIVPFNELDYKNDMRVLDCYGIAIEQYFKAHFDNTDINYHLCYANNIIIAYLGDFYMSNKYTIEIPYGKRNAYLDFALQMNRIVGKHGYVSLFVNNNPYSLQSFLTVESDSNDNTNEINALIQQYHLNKTGEKGFDELFAEMQYRKWNVNIFGTDDDSVELAFRYSYEFASETELEGKGYQNSISIKRKKVFISYCHNDKNVVWNTIDVMQQNGLNIWIDKQDINVGDHILHRVLSGIDECDLAVLFISEFTLKSNFARLELETIMSAMMKKDTGWYIVKLDDVNPDKILPGLSNYLYYDFAENNQIENLVNDISRKIKILS